MLKINLKKQCEKCPEYKNSGVEWLKEIEGDIEKVENELLGLLKQL